MVLVPESCQSRSSRFRENFGVHTKLAAKEWPISKSLRPRSALRLRESCAIGKLYWIVPPVFEVSSIDFAYEELIAKAAPQRQRARVVDRVRRVRDNVDRRECREGPQVSQRLLAIGLV